MRAHLRRRAGLALTLALGLAPRAAAADLQELLGRPLSPGAVGLLVKYAPEPRVLSRWAEALKDTRPEVRAAAARAINVSAAVTLVPDVAAALAAETDVPAAAEQAAAVAALGGQARHHELRAAAQRDARLAPAVAAALARSGGPQAAASGGVSRPTSWRTPEGFPRGLFADVLRVSGCAPGKKDAFHGGQVSYGADGRPRQVAMLAPDRVSPACVQAVEVLLFLDLAPQLAVGLAHSDLLIVSLSRDAIACMSEGPSDATVLPTLLSVGPSGVKPPTKVHHVDPWYPDTVRNERVQGQVVVEAVLASSGCVRSAKLLRGAHPRLDVVALLTVAQWRYTPTLIDGAPVPVIMTITVNFRLS